MAHLIPEKIALCSEIQIFKDVLQKNLSKIGNFEDHKIETFDIKLPWKIKQPREPYGMTFAKLKMQTFLRKFSKGEFDRLYDIQSHYRLVVCMETSIEMIPNSKSAQIMFHCMFYHVATKEMYSYQGIIGKQFFKNKLDKYKYIPPYGWDEIKVFAEFGWISKYDWENEIEKIILQHIPTSIYETYRKTEILRSMVDYNILKEATNISFVNTLSTDTTSILTNWKYILSLCREKLDNLKQLTDCVIGIRTQGCVFGTIIAQYLNVPLLRATSPSELLFPYVTTTFVNENGLNETIGLSSKIHLKKWRGGRGHILLASPVIESANLFDSIITIARQNNDRKEIVCFSIFDTPCLSNQIRKNYNIRLISLSD